MRDSKGSKGIKRDRATLLPFLILLFSTVNETLDSVFDASDDEAEQDAIVTEVLDEIGIDMTSKVSHYNIGILLDLLGY